MRLRGGDNRAEINGLQAQSSSVNYYFGNDAQKWQTNLATFAQVKTANVYQGVDVIYYGNQNRLEYDFVVAPHSSFEQIALEFDGADKLQIQPNGDLLARVGKSEMRQHKPVIYQQINGEKREIAGGYKIEKTNRRRRSSVKFEIGDYDADQPLIIDPTIVFSTLLGGSAGDDFFTPEAGTSITADAAGNVYVAGLTPSSNFPRANAQQNQNAGGYDAFLTKFDPTGSTLLFSTYFGGSADDRITALSLDNANNIYAVGSTLSTDLPLKTPFQAASKGGYETFIARFNAATGALNYSTYFGGAADDFASSIKPDNAGAVYITGDTTSTDLPTTANAVQKFNAGGSDLFAAKLDLNRNAVVFATYYGGSLNENAATGGNAVDSNGNVYLAGVTGSVDFPTTPNAFQTDGNGSDDAVAVKLNQSGSAVVYSTYIGGNLIDSAGAFTVDADGNMLLTGFTRSSNFPLRNAVQTDLQYVDAFVTKLNAAGSDIVYSTFLGGSDLERGYGIAVDAGGNAFVTGRSNSGNFPTRRAVRPARGLDDAFVARFNRVGALTFSTLIGGRGNDNGLGIVADNNNNAFVTGLGTTAFYTTDKAFQRTVNGGADAFVAKINTSAVKAKSDFDGDGKTDYAVWRPSDGVWYILQSSDSGIRYIKFGQSGDIPVPGDYDGNGKTDAAVFRPSNNTWYILNSRTNLVTARIWGANGDIAAPGDFDGDDRTDIAVYRPSNGTWYIVNSSTNNVRVVTFGTSDDKPVPADYDGDTTTDIAVYNPTTNVWTILNSFSGFTSLQFGTNGDRPTPADFNGDGFTDIAVYRPSNGIWYYSPNPNDSNFSAARWGLSGDVPSAGDYDGDGREDFAVFRPSDGIWYILRSSTNTLQAARFGTNGDKPIAAAYTPQ